jgi:hydrogenase/urease accessory protein HupE
MALCQNSGTGGSLRHSLLALFVLATIIRASAHDPGLSAANVRIFPDHIEATISFSLADTAEIVDIDRNHDGQITAEEKDEACAEMRMMEPQGVELNVDERPVGPTTNFCQFDASGNSAVFYSFPAASFHKLSFRSKWLALLQPGHKQFVTLQDSSGKAIAERMLSANSDKIVVEIDLEATPTQQRSAPPEAHPFRDFLVMGIKHIWGGYDHLLFLFGLLIVIHNFGSAFRIITCFTAAHAITLTVATLNIAALPSRVVEPMIAATIIYVGVENLARRGEPKGRWLLTFAFGLIHGFGFASVLRQLGIGSGGGFIVPLVSFNLGVETGQIIVAALALPFIWRLRQNPAFLKRWVPACSIIIAVLGSIWFIQRVWPWPG